MRLLSHSYFLKLMLSVVFFGFSIQGYSATKRSLAKTSLETPARKNITPLKTTTPKATATAGAMTATAVGISFGTPIVDNKGATWAYLVAPVLGVTNPITGHLEVSTDATFESNVSTTADTTISSDNNEIWQMVNKLQPKTTYYFRGVITANGQQLTSPIGTFQTPQIGSSLAVSYDSINSVLYWNANQIGSPDPTYTASAYINWGHSELLGHSSNKISIPQGQTSWMPAQFKQQDGTANPGDTIYWQYVIVSNGENLVYKGDIQTAQIPSYYQPPDTTNPCNKTDKDNTVYRVAQNAVLVCSQLESYPNSGGTLYYATGQLNCPVDYPFNLNYTKGLTFTIPKLGIPVGPFGKSVSYWRSSSNVRFNIFLPGANDGYPGDVQQPGWQKFSTLNWALGLETAQFWIYCGNYKPPPGVSIYNVGGSP